MKKAVNRWLRINCGKTLRCKLQSGLEKSFSRFGTPNELKFDILIERKPVLEQFLLAIYAVRFPFQYGIIENWRYL